MDFYVGYAGSFDVRSMYLQIVVHMYIYTMYISYVHM